MLHCRQRWHYEGVTGANLGALFFSKNWMEIQHGGANKVANDVVE